MRLADALVSIIVCLLRVYLTYFILFSWLPYDGKSSCIYKQNSTKNSLALFFVDLM